MFGWREGTSNVEAAELLAHVAASGDRVAVHLRLAAETTGIRLLGGLASVQLETQTADVDGARAAKAVGHAVEAVDDAAQRRAGRQLVHIDVSRLSHGKRFRRRIEAEKGEERAGQHSLLKGSDEVK